MASNYRVRLKRGDHEIEIESSDKDYVDSKLKEFLAELPTIESKPTPPKPEIKKVKRTKVEKEVSAEPALDVAGFVANIKDSQIYSKVEKNIIDKRDMLPRIMMCMHFASEFSEDPYLTTGQIEAITDQLSIKIGMANAANKIKKYQKYFTGKIVRKKGQPVPYKLNRQGEQAFEKYLNGEKP